MIRKVQFYFQEYTSFMTLIKQVQVIIKIIPLYFDLKIPEPLKALLQFAYLLLLLVINFVSSHGKFFKTKKEIRNPVHMLKMNKDTSGIMSRVVELDAGWSFSVR